VLPKHGQGPGFDLQQYTHKKEGTEGGKKEEREGGGREGEKEERKGIVNEIFNPPLSEKYTCTHIFTIKPEARDVSMLT
jgi:hypothetical protein